MIERHKKLGDGALDKLKNEVQAFAADHTYKETARKFGIHHSTVSGWIKQSSCHMQNKFNAHDTTSPNIQCKEGNRCKQISCFRGGTQSKRNFKATNESISCECFRASINENEGDAKDHTNKVRSNLN